MTDRRYWVSAPIAMMDGMEDEFSEKEAESLAEIDGDLANLGFFRDDENVQWVHKTYDLDEAREIAKEAKKVWSRDTGLAGEEAVAITTQPACPRCGRLGRFSDEFCASCGVKLLPTEGIDPETGDPIPRR